MVSTLLGVCVLAFICSVPAHPQTIEVPGVATAGRAQEQVLYTFQGGVNDGDGPVAGLIADWSGALYGTTLGGGSPGNPSCQIGCGTVFKLTPSGPGYKESVLYKFQGGNDGYRPWGVLIADASGGLYGTTSLGGNSACSGGCGTVFKLSPSGSGYAETVLYRFQGGTDGDVPLAGLIIDARGAIYGATANDGAYGGGTVFKLTPRGSGYTETLLYALRGGATDGDSPEASLLMDASGALYGTTIFGGPQQRGVVFKLTPTLAGYQEKVIHFFQGYDGQWPVSGLISDKSGALYGTTTTGGTATCRIDVYCGTVYKLTPTRSGYAITVLHNFQGGRRDGANSKAGLLAGPKGALFGTTVAGGNGRGGVVFELKPAGSTYREHLLHEFRRGSGGSQSVASLIFGADGSLLGTASIGGNCPQNGGCGTVFKLIR
jgi:uncharacterized repeat protein (TIGR03803 family)